MSDETTDQFGNSWEDVFEMTLASPSGEAIRVKFSHADLSSPERMRARWYAETGWEMPHYSMEQHIEIVKVMFRLAGYEVVGEEDR